MFHIKQLTKKNAQEVNTLRKNSYSKATGMEVRNEGILWNKSDDQSTVLGIFHQSKLIATMRGEIITSLELVEKKMECPWTYGHLLFPVMILSKAAVDSKYEGRGLTSVLRLYFLRLAQQWEIKTILGTMTASSKRIKSMKNLGHCFVENKLGWRNSNYRSQEKVFISILSFDEFGISAINKIESKYRDIIEKDFSAELNSIHYKEVEVVS